MTVNFAHGRTDIIRGWKDRASPSRLRVSIDEIPILLRPDGNTIDAVQDRCLFCVSHRDIIIGDTGPAVDITHDGLRRNNRGRGGLWRTLALLFMTSDRPCEQDAAALLATIVMARTRMPALQDRVAETENRLLERLGYARAEDIWPRKNTKPLPFAAKKGEALLGADGVALGRGLRAWFEHCFARRRVVLARPSPGDQDAKLSVSEYLSVIDTHKKSHVGTSGSREWQVISDTDLQDAVWEEPRSKLQHRFGVTDMAIYARCRKKGMDMPPRGYWQMLRSGRDPRPLLRSHGCAPPQKVMDMLEERFGPQDTIA